MLGGILGFMRAQTVLIIVTMIINVIGLSFLGSRYAVALGLLLAVLDLLPVIGPGLIYLPWIAYQMIWGEVTTAFGLLILYGAVSLLRQVIQTHVVGREMGLHPAGYLVVALCGRQTLWHSRRHIRASHGHPAEEPMGFRAHTSRRWRVLTSLCILGSTGSIGEQTLDVAGSLGNIRVVGLAARSDWRKVLAQARQFGAQVVALEDPSAAERATLEKASFGLEHLRILSGEEAASRLAALPEADVVMHALPGFRGIRPLLSSLASGKRVAFAGKEALVCAGDLLTPYLRSGAQVVPVDSEHSAIFQCLNGERLSDVAEIVLTASGGALRDYTTEQMAGVTPEAVLHHPTWKMGPKVTVDSATLFNKALEVMEAHHLFGMPYSKIKVVVHRESVVHSMVTFVDGSTKAQAARPDMRLAIAYGLTYPKRVPVVPPLSPYTGTLTFEKPDLERFPSLDLGFRAGEMGGTAPCAVSVADEILVDEFLAGRIGFLDIHRILSRVLEDCRPEPVTGVEVLEETRVWATSLVRKLLS